ncbi:MAG: ketopantoate reductase family protein [Promethearchaeota archaeon]
MVSINKIVFFGVGAIGASAGVWIAEKYDETYFLAQGRTKKALESNGITHYFYDGTDKVLKEETLSTLHPVQVLDTLKELTEEDVVVLSVKNFSLSEAAEQIKQQCGDKPIILSMANGRINQNILPKFFSKIIYSVVLWNAWRDVEYLEEEKKLIVGSQKRGPLLIGTLDNALQNEMEAIKEIFDPGLETIVIDEIQNAVHCKIALNVINAITTLIGHGIQPVDFTPFQTLVTNTIWEAVQILKTAGFEEYPLPDMTPWSAIEMLHELPLSATHEQFKHAMSKMQISSMTQDIIQRNLGVSELESLNGYMVKLADKYDMDAPFNRGVYSLAKERFEKGFQPMDANDVLSEVQRISEKGIND